MYRSKKNNPPKRSSKDTKGKGSQQRAKDIPVATPKVEDAVLNAIIEEIQPSSVVDVAHVAQSDSAVSQAQVNSLISSNPNGSSDEQSQLRQIIEFKEKFTAPVAIYDSDSKRIRVNPVFDRAAVAQLARIQGIVLHQLRQSLRDAAARTPKELLFDLERALLCVIASSSVISSASLTSAEAVTPLLHAADAIEVAKAFPCVESMFAQRAAPMPSVAAVGYVFSEGISHDVIDGFLQLLMDRVATESAPSLNTRRTAEERQALQATSNNVRDFTQLCHTFRVAYGGIYTTSQQQRAQPSAVSEIERKDANANYSSAKLLLEGYYKLLRWVLAVEPDRLALFSEKSSIGLGFDKTNENAVATGKTAWVTEYDPHAGKIVIERSSASHRWGLVFDNSGFLVGIDNSLRNGSEAGERLYYALQQSNAAAGMAVLHVNRRRLRATNLTADELAAKKQEILKHLTEGLRREGTTLQLMVEKKSHTELTAAREVFFEASPQGGERGVGQQVVLILERAAPTIPWGLKLVSLPDASPVLKNFSDRLQLSKRAKNFLFDHRGRLRVVSVNYRDTRRHFTTEQLKQYMSESLLLALWLQVTSPSIEEIEGTSSFDETLHIKDTVNNTNFSDSEEADNMLLKGDEEGDKILPDPNATEESAGAVTGRDSDFIGNDGSAEGVGEIGAEDGDWATSKYSNPEEEDIVLKDAELGDNNSLEKDAEHLSATKDSSEAMEVPEEDMPGEGGFTELEGVESGETASMPSSKKDKSTSKKEKKLKKNAKKEKESTRGRKKKSGKDETMTPKGKKGENAAIDEAETNREGIDENIELPDATDHMASNDGNAITDTPLIEPPQTSAEIAIRMARESSAAGSDSPSPRKEKLSKVSSLMPSEESETIAGGVPTTVSDEEVPLVDSLKTSAEVAKEVVAAAGSLTADDAAGNTDSVMPVTITQLLETPPLKFENDVVASKFDGATLELSRPSTEVPWNIKMAFIGDEVLLSKLPPVAPKAQAHPYLRYLGSTPDGSVRCAIESMNGVDLLIASKLEKSKLMEIGKKSTKLSMLLKILR